MAKHKCGTLHTVTISSLYMLFINDSGEIINFHCAKLKWERFSKNGDPMLETRGVRRITSNAVRSVLVHIRCHVRVRVRLIWGLIKVSHCTESVNLFITKRFIFNSE